jgi:transcriptional regulator PpsR
VRLGAAGPVLAVGRDLRAVAAIQQRFIDAQQEMERDYWQRRQAESRYRLLFQVARDAVLVLDAETLRIGEANPMAGALFDGAATPLVGSSLSDRVEPASSAVVDELLSAARTTGRAFEVRARLGEGRPSIDLSATPFRADDRQCLLVRARTVDPSADFFVQMPDAAVITDSAGRIRMANPAFVKLCQAPDEARLRGWLLGDALGDIHHQWPGLLAQVRTHGLVGRAAVRLHVSGAPPLLAEVSGALLAEGDQEDIGFTLRPLAEAVAVQPAEQLTLGLAQLVGQLGQQSLPELLTQATQLAERHLIEAALARTHGNVEDACALLGLPASGLAARMEQLGLAPRSLLN